MADGQAGQGFVDILPRSDKFSSTLSSQIDPKLQQVGSSASSITSKASTAFAALGVVAVASIGKGIQATQQWASEVKLLQRVTGQSAEDASRLATAGQELGLSTQQLATGFGALGKNIINGSANLERYGVVTKDASGATLPFNEILGNISDKFLTLQKGPEQAAFAMNVFGKSGKDLIPILSQGADGLAELEAKADEYGTTLSQKDLDASRELSIAQRELGLAFKGASISIGRDFLPVLTRIVSGVTKVVEVIHLIPQPLLTVVTGFVALTGGAAALGKGLGFVKDGLGELGSTFGISSRFTDAATKALAGNTEATVTNAAAQGSLEAEANSVTTTLSTTADVVEVGTKATEASTTAVVADTAAQAGRETVAKSSLATTFAQVKGQQALFDATLLGTGAVGDAAAAQTTLFNTTTLATGALEREALVAKGGGAAGIAGGVAGRFAGGFAVAKVGLVELGVGLAGARAGIGSLLQDSGDLADEFKITADQAGEIKKRVDAIGPSTILHRLADPFGQSGANAAEASAAFGDFAQKAIAAGAGQGQISKALDAALPKLNANRASIADFTDELEANLQTTIKAEVAHEKLTKRLILERNPIRELVSEGSTFQNVLGLMGVKTGEFAAEAKNAFRTGQFRAWATDFKSTAVDAWQQFRDAASSSLDFEGQVVAQLGTNLEKGQHLTAQSILKQFQDAAEKTREFGRNLLEVSHIGGAAAKSLANSLLQSGNVLAAQVIANAPKKVQDQIVTAFGVGSNAADTFSTKLTNAIVGPLNDITHLLEAIAKHWHIDVSFLDHGASDRLRTLQTQVDAISGAHTVSFIQEGQPAPPPPRTPPPKTHGGTGALGGIFAAQSGVIVRRPTVLVGEGFSPTPFGPGAEAILPLQKIKPLLVEAVGDAMGHRGSEHIHITVGFDDSGNLEVRRIARDEIDREHDFRARVG